jgi:hypothetical protein
MLCVEDYLDALDWAKNLGGLRPDRAGRRQCAGASSTASALTTTGSKTSPVDPATRSNTSVCLKIHRHRASADGAAFRQGVAKRLEAEGVALDIGAYRDAPAGSADLVRRHGRDLRHRGDAAVARLGLPGTGSRSGRPPEQTPRGRAATPARSGSPISRFRPYQGGHHGPQSTRIRQAVGNRRPDLPRSRHRRGFHPTSARTRTSCSKSSASMTASPSARPPR